MATIQSFITSDTTQVLQFLLTLGVIAVLIILCVQLSARLRFFERENMQMKREIDELQHYSDRCIQGIRDRLENHSALLSQIGTHLDGGDLISAEDFDSLGEFSLTPASGEVRIDLDGLTAVSDRNEPLVNAEIASMQSAPVEQDVDVSFPLRAEVTNITDGSRFIEQADRFDEKFDEDPDPLTRALKISRTVNR